MAFVTVPGLEGKVYVPEKNSGEKRKHHCEDCYFCQQCSDDRCNLCLDKPPCSKKKSPESKN